MSTKFKTTTKAQHDAQMRNSALLIKNYNSDMEAIEPGLAVTSDYLSEHANEQPESETLNNISKKHVVPTL